MAFIKLDKPGARQAVRVKTVSIDKSGKWPDYHFSDGTITVVVPKAAADRQITQKRVGTDSAFDLVGSIIEVSRTEKVGPNGNPFWDINLLSVDDLLDREKESPRVQSPYVPKGNTQGVLPGEEPEPTSSSYEAEAREFAEPAQTPRERTQESLDERRERFIGFYLQVYETVLSSMERTHAESGTPLTADAVQAATATIVIQMDRKGML